MLKNTEPALSQYSPRNFNIWMLLTFQAGLINVGGFLSCHRFVTHITGFATFFGIEASHSSYLAALGMLVVPLFFLGGAMLAAVFTERRSAQGLDPRYDLLILFIAFLTTAVGVLGSLDFFGVWGHTFFVERDFILLAALCLASGIQNGAISSASGAQVRTTHLTGITTDLGLGIIRLLSKGKRHGDYPKEIFGNILRTALILAFVIGSVVGAKIFMNFEYYGFFLPGLISTILYIYALSQK